MTLANILLFPDGNIDNDNNDDNNYTTTHGDDNDMLIQLDALDIGV